MLSCTEMRRSHRRAAHFSRDRSSGDPVNVDASVSGHARGMRGMAELLDPFFLLGQLRSGLTTAMFLFLIASGLSLIFGVLEDHQLRARLPLHDRGLHRLEHDGHSRPHVDRLPRRGRGRLALGRGPRRPRGALPAALHVQARGALSAALHLRAGADLLGCLQVHLGHAAAFGLPPADAVGQLRLLRRALSPLRSLHHRCSGR